MSCAVSSATATSRPFDLDRGELGLEAAIFPHIALRRWSLPCRVDDENRPEPAALNDMGRSDDPEEPPPRQTRLPPDLLGTWWECVLAIMAIGFVVWLIDDIARYGL